MHFHIYCLPSFSYGVDITVLINRCFYPLKQVQQLLFNVGMILTKPDQTTLKQILKFTSLTFGSTYLI